MALALPPTGVIRVSRGTFDPARFPDGDRMAHETGTYLIPAIRRLTGPRRILRGSVALGLDGVPEPLEQRRAGAAHEHSPGDDRRRPTRAGGSRRSVQSDRQLSDRLVHLTTEPSVREPIERP